MKYCGACNPEIDVAPIGRKVRELLAGADFVPLGRAADLVIILNACPVACADRLEVRALAKRAIVMAGRQIGLRPVPEEQIVERLAEVALGRNRHAYCRPTTSSSTWDDSADQGQQEKTPGSSPAQSRERSP